MYFHELPPIPRSPRPSIPPASPRTIPSIPSELPKILSEFPIVDPESKIGRVVERVRLYSDPVDVVDSRASSRLGALRQEHQEELIQDAGAKIQKSGKQTKGKRKRKAKRKHQEDPASVSVLEALHPQGQKHGLTLHRAGVDDGLQRAEEHMSEMASQRLAVVRKASVEQRARARARALIRQQQQPQKMEHVTETSKDELLPIESVRSPSLPKPKAVANRRTLYRQPSGNKDGVNVVRQSRLNRFNSEASLIADSSILSVIRPSRDKTERMTDLRKRAALFKKECVRRSRLLKRQLSYDALPEIEQQLYQKVYARAHADVQHLSCRLAELGLIGKDDKETEAIKASCSNFLGRNDDNIISFALDLVPSVRKQLREGQRETFLNLFASVDRFGLSPGLTEESCLGIMTNLYVGVVSSSDLDVLKKELSNAFRLAMDTETAKIDAEQFVKLFWHLRETYDREHAERERRIIEKYGIDIDSDDARMVKDDLLSLHELVGSQSDNQEERRLDLVDVRGIVGIFIESGLLPYGGDQSFVTDRWFKEMSGKKEIEFQDLRRLVEKIREEAWQKERQHVERIFEEFDKNRTGSLSIVQISAFFKSLGLLPRSKSDQDELKRLLEEVDLDSSGALDFNEFSRLVQKVTIKLRAAQRRRENEVSKQLDFTQHQLSELREAYFTLDVNTNHLLEINECRKALTLMHKDMSGQALNELFGVLDKDHDGRINFEEFLFFMKAVEKQDWRPFIREKFLARGEALMMEKGRHVFRSEE